MSTHELALTETQLHYSRCRMTNLPLSVSIRGPAEHTENPRLLKRCHSLLLLLASASRTHVTQHNQHSERDQLTRLTKDQSDNECHGLRDPQLYFPIKCLIMPAASSASRASHAGHMARQGRTGSIDRQKHEPMLPGYADTDTGTRYGDMRIRHFSQNADTGIRQYI